MAIGAFFGGVAGSIAHGSVHSATGPLMRSVDQIANRLYPNALPTISEIIDAMLRGFMTPSKARNYLSLHGVWIDPDAPEAMGRARQPIKVISQAWQSVIQASTATPEFGILLDLWRRQQIGDDEFTVYLKRLGFARPDDQLNLKVLKNVLPSITDALTFARLNIFVPAVVQGFGLDNEFDRFWQGQLRDWLSGQGVSEDLAHAYWRAHWVRPSLSVAAEAVRRLRPGRVAPAVQFTKDDYDRVAQENDILPYWRERQLLLSYTPPGLRALREQFNNSAISKTELIAGFEDIGYQPKDAGNLANAWDITKARTRAQNGHGFTAAKVAEFYGCGALTDAAASSLMAALGYTGAETDEMKDRVRLEWDCRLKTVKIEVIHKAFLRGEIDEIAARGSLGNLTVPVFRIDSYLELWTTERDTLHKTDTIHQLVDWFKRGLLTVDQLIRQLTRLHVSTDDQARILLAALQDIQAAIRKETLKELLALQRAREKQLRLLEQAELRRERRAKLNAGAAATEFAAKVRGQAAFQKAVARAKTLEDLVAALTPQEKAELRGQLGEELATISADTGEVIAHAFADVQRMPPP